jgi:hypothetical protein
MLKTLPAWRIRAGVSLDEKNNNTPMTAKLNKGVIYAITVVILSKYQYFQLFFPSSFPLSCILLVAHTISISRNVHSATSQPEIAHSGQQNHSLTPTLSPTKRRRHQKQIKLINKLSFGFK